MSRLHLVISLDSLFITRRHALSRTRRLSGHLVTVLTQPQGRGHRLGGAIILILLAWTIRGRRTMTDVVVRDRAVLGVTLRYGAILVGFWVLGDDEPGMDQTGQKAEHAQENIDDGVRTADASFDPYCDEKIMLVLERGGDSARKKSVGRKRTWERWKEDGEDAEKEVGGAHDLDCLV